MDYTQFTKKELKYIINSLQDEIEVLNELAEITDTHDKVIQLEDMIIKLKSIKPQYFKE